MKLALWSALAGLVLLTACGAGDPPTAPGAPDLSSVWNPAS